MSRVDPDLPEQDFISDEQETGDAVDINIMHHQNS